MKKIYSLISLLVLSMAILAQSNRTSETIVTDVLAQMPAQNGSVFNSQLKDLSSTGEDGVLQLVKRINPPGKGDNSQVEYALSGLSHYVSAEGRESQRVVTSNAYVKALDMVSDREIRAFIIRQLEVIGKDEAVAKLATYLENESLSGPASRALLSIGTPAAQKALVNALSSATNSKSKQDIVLGIAGLKVADTENTLKRLLGSGDANLNKTVIYALGQVGTKASLSDLASLAAKDGYTMKKEGANEAYIALIKRVLSQGGVSDAEKAAKDLLKKAEQAGQTQTRVAALEILMAAKPAGVLKQVQNAMKDKDTNYRYAALDLASKYADRNMYAELIKSLKKAKPEVQVNILDWLGQECADSQKCQLIGSIGNADIINLLTNNNPAVKKASAQILSKTAGKESILNLAQLLNDADVNTVKIGKDALSATKGDISSAVAPVIGTANTAGKVAGLQLLAQRKSTANINIVLDQLNAESPDVKAAAYSALKDVVTSNDLNKLYTLLEQAEPNAVPSVQQAIIAAMRPYSKEEQLTTVSARMNQVVKSKQYLYYPVLASTGESKALEMITERFSKENGNSKDAAFQALLDWKGLEAAGELYSICKDASATSYFDCALERYIQLVSSPQLSGENRRLFLTNAMDIAKKDSHKAAILSRLGNTGSYLGMLLAGQYLDDKAVAQQAANAVMNIALNNKGFTGKDVEELLNKVITVLNNPDAEYQRQAIRKHLAEMPKGEGFVSIFNGRDLAGWKGLVGNPITRTKMKPAELTKRQAEADKAAAEHWRAENGILIFDGKKGGDNLCTIKQYGDFEMYVDWNLDPAGPEADAGVYLRGTPQVQIWDIARVKVGAQVGSGGLYNNKKNPSKPLKLADNKLGEWNTLYIKMVGERVTVKLNGELVVDDVILENFWDRNSPIPAIEQIELQAHGSKVYYRNIYVKEL